MALLARTRESAAEVFAALTHQNARADLTALWLGKLSAMERMIQLVLHLHERVLACIGVEEYEGLPLRRDDLADALGLTPVHVSRTLTKLRSAGLIDCRGGIVRILDKRGLQAIA